MSPLRKTAIAVGVLFLTSDVTAVIARFMYGPVLEHPDRAGGDTNALLGGVIEVVMALAIVGTSVVLYPIAKRQNHAVALGYVALRTLEASVVLTGVVSVFTLVSVRSTLDGAEGAGTISQMLVAFQDWTFLVGPGLVCGANTVLMASIMFRSNLIPRFIAVLGLAGGPLVFALNALKLFGVEDAIMPWAALGVLPIFAWEVLLSIYLIARGFRLSALARLDVSPAVGETRLVTV